MAGAAETSSEAHDGKTAPGFTDLGELIARETDHRYPYAGRRFLLSQPQATQRLACGELLDPACLESVISRFAGTYPPDTDRRALVSLWTLYYFSALMIDPILCWLELRRVLPLALDEIDVLIDSTTGLPSHFLLNTLGEVQETATVHEAMSGVIRQHLEPLIAVIAKQCGLSKRVLWTNATGYLSWMIHEIGQHGSEALKAEGMALIEAPIWPDQWKNPLHNLVQAGCSESGDYIGHRRICCMRYAVPGVGGCGRSCPVPEGRNAAS
jgi:ferric iron reductase protein FhuF